MKYSLEDNKEAIIYMEEFKINADEKLQQAREKYGPLECGEDSYDNINGHMIDEFAEWFVANYGSGWRSAVTYMVDQILERSKKPNQDDIAGELYDIRNMAMISYMCGKIKGFF